MKRAILILCVLCLMISGNALAEYTTDTTPRPIPVIEDNEITPTPAGMHHYMLICNDQWQTDPDNITHTDGLILLSVDEIAGRVMLTSFIRDMLIQRPDGKFGRINNVCLSFGADRTGIEHLTHTISTHFDVEIDKNALAALAVKKEQARTNIETFTLVDGRIVPDGTKFTIPEADKDATAATNIHQGGIVQTQKGEWWALLMMDFHSVGRTVTLAPMTWIDGWPMVGLHGNPGRSPRTWLKPDIDVSVEPHAAYDRNETFDGKELGRVWQWNHNPDDRMWSLTKGRLRLQTMPSEQLMWARNSLTQRVIGPSSVTTVELYTKNMKDGDVAGLGNINVPCSWIGIVKAGKNQILRFFEQAVNDTIDMPADNVEKIYLRMVGDFDNNRAHYEYSFDGTNYSQLGREMTLSYQTISFQGSRASLFAFNVKGSNGGYAEFDNFTVNETAADRSDNIPYGKTFRIVNLATGKPMIALPHGLMHDTRANDKSKQTYFHIIDKGKGQVVLQCEDGRYVFVSGFGLPGDVRLTTDESKAEVFMWQDFLNKEFMLMSMRTHLYIGKSPTTGSPYSMDYKGADPARRNGAVFRWEE